MSSSAEITALIQCPLRDHFLRVLLMNEYSMSSSSLNRESDNSSISSLSASLYLTFFMTFCIVSLPRSP